MKYRNYEEGGVVKQHLSKIDELLLVERGQIDIFLPTGGKDLLFEQLSMGSSFGQHSFLQDAFSPFILLANRSSSIQYITKEMMT